MRSRIASLLFVLLFAALPLQAGEPTNWPNWRGPLLSGVSPDGNPPIEWSETHNVRFKVAVPGRALSSPVVWGDKIFVMSSMSIDAAAYSASQQAASQLLERNEWPPKVSPVEQRFLVMAYSRLDGTLIWQRTATQQVPHESHYIDSAWSCASPVTDGTRVIAHFGSNGTYAYDMDGQLLWQTDLGDMATRRGFGEGSSPALHDDTLVVNWDHEGESFLVALDAATGKERWRAARPGEVSSWATPLIVERDGQTQIVIPATGRSRGYDLETGRELWSVSGMTVNTIPTPVERDGLVFLASGYRGTMLQAIDLALASGELEKSEALRWIHDRDTPYVPSLLLYDDTLYFLKHYKNILSVLDATSGEPRRPPARLEALGAIWASPVGAAGRVYVFDRDGKAVVFEHGSKMKVLAVNELDGIVDATPAIVGDGIYVRTRTHLYGIARDGDGARPAIR
ncbi:MAG: PQQ-like beta-propeller repeat protein [Acidobacteriota bacterium]|nr:PQQ-like beta-propeller repeat protein [Acidobacteriota bacterium]